jgi:hypothetical protein
MALNGGLKMRFKFYIVVCNMLLTIRLYFLSASDRFAARHEETPAHPSRRRGRRSLVSRRREPQR